MLWFWGGALGTSIWEMHSGVYFGFKSKLVNIVYATTKLEPLFDFVVFWLHDYKNLYFNSTDVNNVLTLHDL